MQGRGDRTFAPVAPPADRTRVDGLAVPAPCAAPSLVRGWGGTAVASRSGVSPTTSAFENWNLSQALDKYMRLRRALAPGCSQERLREVCTLTTRPFSRQHLTELDCQARFGRHCVSTADVARSVHDPWLASLHAARRRCSARRP